MNDSSVLIHHPGCNPICRACHYKNDDYDIQVERKKDWARQQLGRWENVTGEFVIAPEKERIAYRSKSWMRSHWNPKAIEAERLSFGMVRALRTSEGWEKEHVSWDHCPMHTVSIQKTLIRLRALFSLSLSEFAEKDLWGVWFGAPHCVIVHRSLNPEGLKAVDWHSILEPPLTHIWAHFNPQVGKSFFGSREIVPLWGGFTEGLHPIRAFRQVAQSLLRQARTAAARAILRTEPELCVDLYCGTGDFSVELPACVNWIGIESSADAVQYAQTLAVSERAVHRAYAGTVEQRLRDPQVRAQIRGRYTLYLNPPRSGVGTEAHECIREIILENPPAVIAYLSCSASSLARDLDEFERRGYRVQSLQSFDFFPQTEHFETLAVLKFISGA